MNGSIASRITSLQAELNSLASSGGRQVKLLLVTKFVEPARIREAYDAGSREFGENHAQEIRDKRLLLPEDIRWHMIGRLQTNKIKYLVGTAAMIHSLDRMEQALEIERQAVKKDIPFADCLVQVNSSEESQKGGVPFPEAGGLIQGILQNCPRIRLRGMMTVGPETSDSDRIRKCFRRTSELRRELQTKFSLAAFDELSMGMSQDYRIAVEEGSTLVRVGSLVFGPRPPA